MDPVDLSLSPVSFCNLRLLLYSASKRSVYLMPIYPFIAYFLAKYLFYLVKKQSKVIKVYEVFLQ